MEKAVWVLGKKIFYEEKGQGEVLVILHGWGKKSLEDYFQFQENLASLGFRVFLFHLPGFGKSNALSRGWKINDYIFCVLGAIQNLGINKFYLLGHSFGATIAVKLAIQRPELIKGLILCAPGIIGVGFRARFRRVARARTIFTKGFQIFGKVSGFWLKFGKYPFLILKKLPWISLFFEKLEKELEFILSHIYHFCLFMTGYRLETLRLMVIEDVAPYLNQIKIPTLIIWGNKDRAIGQRDVWFVAEQIPNSLLIEIEGAPHAIKGDFAKKVAKIIKDFEKGEFRPLFFFGIIKMMGNILIQYLEWHYFQRPKGIILGWKNFLKFNLHFFSVFFLLKTLFSHWHRYRYSYGRGFDLGRYFQVFTFNLTSRILGAAVRSILILIGIFFEILIFLIGILILIWWLTLPALLAGGLFWGIKILFF